MDQLACVLEHFLIRHVFKSFLSLVLESFVSLTITLIITSIMYPLVIPYEILSFLGMIFLTGSRIVMQG